MLSSRLSNRPSRGISKFLDTSITNPDNNIFKFTVPANAKSTINKDSMAHLNFKIFANKIIKDVAEKELDENIGEIITIHKSPLNKEVDNNYLEGLKNKYTELYLSDLQPTNDRNATGQLYPRFSEDLFAKNNKMYETYEADIGISPLETQTYDEIWKTLEKRIEGLRACLQNPDIVESPDRLEYYQDEYKKELELFQNLDKNDKLSINEKIGALCGNISWTTGALFPKSENFKLEEFTKFLHKDNGKELKMLMTFLDDKYFIKNDVGMLIDININELMDKINKSNTSINQNELGQRQRQTLFGFSDDLNIFMQFKIFIYQIKEIMPAREGKYNCNRLVNWSIFLNMLYDYCAICKNSKGVDFPARFILPNYDYSLVDSNNPDKGIKIRYAKQLFDLFDSKTKFIGLLIIKNSTKGQRRLAINYIFKNLKRHPDRFDTLLGINPEYFIVNNKMQFVNYGMLLTRPNITFTELRHFASLANREPTPDKPAVHLYSFREYPMDIFLSANILDSTQLERYEMQDLHLEKVSIKDDVNQNFIITRTPISHIPEHANITTSIAGGGSRLNKQLSISLSSLQFSNTNQPNDLYYTTSKLGTFISGIFYNKFMQLTEDINILYHKNPSEYVNKYKLISRILYDYILVDDFELNIFTYSFITHQQSLPKYAPLSPKYYHNLELLQNSGILDKLTYKSNILCVSNLYSTLEFIKYKKFNKKTRAPTIHFILPKPDGNINITNYINNLQSIYDIKPIIYDDVIYNILELPGFETANKNKMDFIMYSVQNINKQLNKEMNMFENHMNTPNILTGLILAIKYLAMGGNFILDFGSCAYKPLADLYLILTQYFENSSLYYPEISNLLKRVGTFGVFLGFKGVPEKEYLHLVSILEDVKKLYPKGSASFNIYNDELRKKYNITKPIDESLPKQYINGFCRGVSSDNSQGEKLYEYIRLFNETRYLKQYIYMSKFMELYALPLKLLQSIKIPAPTQITNAVVYCQKWDIPYWDKFSREPFLSKFGKHILEETYGLHEPIIFHFRTLNKAHFAKMLSLHLHLSSKSSKSSKSLSKKYSGSRSGNSAKLSKLGSISRTLLRPSMFLNESINEKQKNKKKTNKNYNRKLPLLPELEPLTIRIEQTGYLIDSRRDFNQTDPAKQNTKWWEVNKQFRFYKHKDDTEKMHLDQLVRKQLKDDTISQAWLKMYEIITDCNLVPTTRKGTFHSFHIAEAPGTFINALNNYIHTKTQFTTFEWHAQSLHAPGTRIGDQFGLIKRHPQRWDWGATKDGDITKIRNIKYYKQRVASRPHISLMTSDAGLAMKESGYEKVAFASLLAILDILPVGASMVYKILTPIDEPLVLNLLYVAYCNFRQLIFYKPVQNNQSREFYVIGKGYLGTAPDILEVFYNELKDYKEGSTSDLFHDKYPEAFVRQFVAISRQLADNYCYTIERNIYYLDNYEHITPEFSKMARDYYDEKNRDWLDKYKPKRIENEVDRL